MNKKKSASSKRWLVEHKNDAYVLRARREGYRARSAYKLEELNERDRLLRPGITVVDLGAAPGGWCQYLQRHGGGKLKIFALDILPMEPLPGVNIILGDFREVEVLKQLEQELESAKVDLVLSDMAPNISGVGAADQAGSVHLAELALEFTRAHLAPDGTFVVKLFQGEGFDAFLKQMRGTFGKVAIRKPKASRPRSSEVYLVARNPRLG